MARARLTAVGRVDFNVRSSTLNLVLKRRFRFCGESCQVHSVSGRRANQSRPAHVHLFDRDCHFTNGANFFNHKSMRKKALID